MYGNCYLVSSAAVGETHAAFYESRRRGGHARLLACKVNSVCASEYAMHACSDGGLLEGQPSSGSSSAARKRLQKGNRRDHKEAVSYRPSLAANSNIRINEPPVRKRWACLLLDRAIFDVNITVSVVQSTRFGAWRHWLKA